MIIECEFYPLILNIENILIFLSIMMTRQHGNLNIQNYCLTDTLSEIICFNDSLCFFSIEVISSLNSKFFESFNN